VSAEQIALLKNTFATVPSIAVDQEGGSVQRYKSQGLVASAEAMRNLTPDQAYDAYLKDSKFLASLGITTNFAPVVDVASRTPSPLPGRMYSGDPAVVSIYSAEAVRAM